MDNLAYLSTENNKCKIVFSDSFNEFNQTFGNPLAKSYMLKFIKSSDKEPLFTQDNKALGIDKGFVRVDKAISIAPGDYHGFQISLNAFVNNTICENIGKEQSFIVEIYSIDQATGTTDGAHKLTFSAIGNPQEKLQLLSKAVYDSSFSAIDGAQEQPQENTTSQNVEENTVHAETDKTVNVAEKKKFSLPLLIGLIVGGLLLLALLVFLALYLLGIIGGKSSSAASEPVAQESSQAQEEPSTDDDNPFDDGDDDEDDLEAPVDTESSTNVATDEDSSSVKAPAANSTSVTTTAGGVACTITTDSDDQIIKTCLASKPETKALIAFSNEAIKSDRCDIAKRIFSSKGRQDANFAYVYAQYFDPNSQVAADCLPKDKKQAIYWYQKAAEKNPNQKITYALNKLQ